MADRTVIARIPAGQSLELFSTLCGFFGAALDNCLMSAGDGYGNAAEVVSGDGVTHRDIVRALEAATRKLNDGGPVASPTHANANEDEDDSSLTLNNMRATDDGVSFGIGGAEDHAAELAKNVLAAFIPVFESTGAVNYLSWDAVLPETGGRYSLIVVKPDGLTPHEARQRAEDRADRLAALLADHGIEVPSA